MDTDFVALAGLGFVACVALYGGLATRAALRRDWPARKVRLRGGASTQGPFRSLEHVREREVSAGPPWAVHLAALLGHGLAPLACFSTAAGWWIAIELAVYARTQAHTDGWIGLVVGLSIGFVVGLRQWKGSTVMLSTEYPSARRATLGAVAARAVADGVPLGVLALHWSAMDSGRASYAAMIAAPLAHATFAALAVLASKQHYLAAAVALEERAANRAGAAPTA